MNIIIIEGVDCSGKSTLAMEFVNEKWNYFHFKNPPEHIKPEHHMEYQKEQYFNHAYHVFPFISHTVMDRFYLGEAVYSPVIRNYFPDYMRELESLIYANCGLVVCTAPLEVLESRFDHEFITQEQIKVIDSLYKEQYEKSILRKMLVDTHEMGPSEIKRMILKRWEIELGIGSGSEVL